MTAIAAREDRAEPLKNITLPFKSWDQLAWGLWRNVILIWAAAAEGITHNILLPFVPVQGIILHMASSDFCEKSHKRCSTQLCTTPQGQGPACWTRPRGRKKWIAQQWARTVWGGLSKSCKDKQTPTLAATLPGVPRPATPQAPLVCCPLKVRLVTEELQRCFRINSY